MYAALELCPALTQVAWLQAEQVNGASSIRAVWMSINTI